MQVKCPLNVTIAVYNSDWKGRRLGNTISIWYAWKLAGILLARWPRETHVLQKSLQKFNTQKKHLNCCMCILMCMCVCMTSTVPGWPGLSCGCCPCPRPSSPPSTYPFLPSLPGTMLRAPASVQCSLHQLPAGRPSCNSFLPLSMKAMVFQRGRLFPASGHGRLLLLLP